MAKKEGWIGDYIDELIAECFVGEETWNETPFTIEAGDNRETVYQKWRLRALERSAAYYKSHPEKMLPETLAHTEKNDPGFARSRSYKEALQRGGEIVERSGEKEHCIDCGAEWEAGYFHACPGLPGENKW